MIGTFTFENLPCRVVFGSGTLALAKAEVERLGGKRALVLTTPQQEAQGKSLGAALGPLYAGIFPGATMHTPVEVTARALAAMKACEADCVISLGGGSTTGLGKALALSTGINQLCIPTTYAGSEMTPIVGQTENGLKTTVRDAAILPETVIYDVDLTLTLPASLAATSGINAIAHAVEALYARDTNPVTSLMAEEGIRALARALPAIAAKSDDRGARTEALYGAWLCGVCLGTVGMALHHKLCHTLGGTFDLPHAETHTIVLPHALAYNARRARCDGAHLTRDRRRRCIARTFRAREAAGCKGRTARHRHARRRHRQGCRPRRHQCLLESAPARTRRHPRPDRARLGRRAARRQQSDGLIRCGARSSNPPSSSAWMIRSAIYLAATC